MAVLMIKICFIAIALGYACLSHGQVDVEVGRGRALLAPAVSPAASMSPSLQQNEVSVLMDPSYGPLPGRDEIFSNSMQLTNPFPANYTGAVMNSTVGAAGPDDVLFQNLLSAEWVVYSFYQAGIEAFDESDFVAVGFPNNTYERLMSIRDNEAGHLRIFQNAISPNSIKPGPCKYNFSVVTGNAATYMGAVVFIEAGSLAFLSGLVQTAVLNATRAALTAVAQVESRHSTWSLGYFGADPFTGPVETVYPYPNQILATEDYWILPGSCPVANPPFPIGAQNIPPLTYFPTVSDIRPGGRLVLNYANASRTVNVVPGKQYYAVTFHALYNISAPFNISSATMTIPVDIEDKGMIVIAIADQPGAPTAESVVAGPLLLTLFPKIVNTLIPGFG